MKQMTKKMMLLLMLACTTLSIYAAVPIYVWQSWDNNTTAETIRQDFQKWKSHGVVGVCYSAGFDAEKVKIAAKEAKALGLEYHAWIPCMLQGGCDSTWYAVNRLGQRSTVAPAYVPYYTCLDPRNPEVQTYLINKYKAIAEIPEVDYVQLDYIRYVDVILARGLWNKYGLVMNEEYDKADYCYCKDCVAAFKAKTGIDITQYKDPSKCKAWAQFRCDIITDFVNKLTDAIHATGKKVSADVFPGPYGYAVKMVRQEWNKWKIDAFFPMNYNDFYLEGPAWVGKITKKEVKTLKGEAPLYSGLFICHNWQNKGTIVDPEGKGLVPSEMEKAVIGAMKGGAKGICLFTPKGMTDEHWAALQSAIEKWDKK
jgi:uncharacterized lipoprotein YddW (UPF0748 family)